MFTKFGDDFFPQKSRAKEEKVINKHCNVIAIGNLLEFFVNQPISGNWIECFVGNLVVEFASITIIYSFFIFWFDSRKSMESIQGKRFECEYYFDDLVESLIFSHFSILSITWSISFLIAFTSTVHLATNSSRSNSSDKTASHWSLKRFDEVSIKQRESQIEIRTKTYFTYSLPWFESLIQCSRVNAKSGYIMFHLKKEFHVYFQWWRE